MGGWLSSVRARFTVVALGDRLDAATSARLDAALALVRERLDAADLLWLRPHRSESMRMLARAAEALESALATARAGLPAEVLLPAESGRSALREIRAHLERAPLEDEAVSADDLGWRRRGRRFIRGLAADLRRTTRRRRQTLARRAALVAAGVVLCAALGAAHAVIQDRVELVASASALGYEAEGAADGNPGTEWLLPDGQAGWLDLRWRRPHDVTGVRVINASNGALKDRATRDLEIALYDGPRLLARTTTSFLAIDPDHNVRDLAIAAKGVTRVRFSLLNFHGNAAGLADVEVITTTPGD
jgi:hypothetical protein